MYARKVKRKCNVRGCKNTDCFAVSRTRELGNTVIICRACLERALEKVTPTENTTKPDVEPDKQNVEAAERTKEQTAPEEQTEADAEATASDAGDEVFACPDCGKMFESEKGLKSHMRYCKGRNE